MKIIKLQKVSKNKEFIKLTENAYCGDVIRELKGAY